MIKLKSYAAITHQGPKLGTNEDDVDIDLVNHLYSIYDGLGGAGIGDKTVKLAKESVRGFYGKVGGDVEATMPFFFSAKYLIEGNALINALHFSHAELKARNDTKNLFQKGATSVLAVGMAENLATVASVGNCLGLLCRKGKVHELVIPDHAQLLSPGHPFPKANTYPLSALGLFDDIHVQVKEVRVLPEDLLVLMTDGIYAHMSLPEIGKIVDNKALGLKERIQTCFNLANTRGNGDNQAALLLQF